MRKISFSILFMLVTSVCCHAQTLEIIDAVAGTLLPKVVEGFKSIKESGNKNTVKVDRKEFNQATKDLQDYMNGITTSLAQDAKSLDAIGNMAASASLLYDDLGAMETMINEGIINAILTSNNEAVKRQFAFAFNRDYKQLKANIGGVKADVLKMEIDQTLKDNLGALVDEINGEMVDFDTFLEQAGVNQLSQGSSIEQVDNYLNAMKNSALNIRDIKRSVQKLLSTFNSRLSSYVKSASDAKNKVDSKFEEISNAKAPE